jgi:hypothetical protein
MEDRARHIVERGLRAEGWFTEDMKFVNCGPCRLTPEGPRVISISLSDDFTDVDFCIRTLRDSIKQRRALVSWMPRAKASVYIRSMPSLRSTTSYSYSVKAVQASLGLCSNEKEDLSDACAKEMKQLQNLIKEKGSALRTRIMQCACECAAKGEESVKWTEEHIIRWVAVTIFFHSISI